MRVVGRLAAALAVALVLSCAGPAAAAPDDAITPLEQYTTVKAKTLARLYRDQLVQLYDNVYHCLPWLGVRKNGIGFRQPKGLQTDDRYLSLWVSIDQTDDGSFARMPRERRVSAMFSRYGVDLLRRMNSFTAAASDANVAGFSVVLSWLKPGTQSTQQPVSETLALFVDKGSLVDFFAQRLGATDFASRAKFSVFEGNDPVGPVQLEVWEDSFNRTFKLKNYEAPKDKCS
jgi:hypothetical protein